MNSWFTKSENGFTGWFAVVSDAGTLRTGLTSGSFTVTVRNPQDTSSGIFDVSESGKGGLYKFFVTSSFLLTHGVGTYGVVVEVSASSPTIINAFSNTLKVSNEDFDSLMPSSSITSIVSGTTTSVWDTSSTTHRISGTMGALLFSASTGPTPVIDYATIADFVWDEQLSGHSSAGSAGLAITQASSSISQISGTINVIAGDVSFMKSIDGGRWKIDNNQMIFYAADNVTEVARFNLFDDNGLPTEESVFERVRV